MQDMGPDVAAQQALASPLRTAPAERISLDEAAGRSDVSKPAESKAERSTFSQ
jgi:hypothetical protein